MFEIPQELVGADKEAFVMYATRWLRTGRLGSAHPDGLAYLNSQARKNRPFIRQIPRPRGEADELRVAGQICAAVEGHVRFKGDEEKRVTCYYVSRHCTELLEPLVAYSAPIVHDKGENKGRRRRQYVPNAEEQQVAKQVVLDLDELRRPKHGELLVDVVEHADFDADTLRRIRDAASSRLTEIGEAANPAASPSEVGEGKAYAPGKFTLQEADRKYEADKYAATKARVFGAAEPSVQGLQVYLDSLHAAAESGDADEKSAICKTINFWKDQLGVEFEYAPDSSKERSTAVICTLAFKPDAGNGAFRLASGELPQPIRFGRNVRWRLADLESWIETRANRHQNGESRRPR